LVSCIFALIRLWPVSHEALEVGEVLLLSRVGVVLGEGGIDVGEQGMVGPWEQLDEAIDDRARRAVLGVPRDRELWREGRHVDAAKQPRDVTVDQIDVVAARVAVDPVAGDGHDPESLDVGPVERAVGEEQLKPVVIGWVVAAGDHDPAVAAEFVDGIIEHRRQSEADTDGGDAARIKSGDELRGEARW
jgi:hypothetical protein